MKIWSQFGVFKIPHESSEGERFSPLEVKQLDMYAHLKFQKYF